MKRSNKNTEKSSVNRRGFLKGAAVGAAAGASLLVGKTASETMLETCHAGIGALLTDLRQANDFFRAQQLFRALLVVSGKSRSGEKGLDATVVSAVAAGPGKLAGPRPGQRIVSPFTGYGMASGEHPPPDDDAAADTGAEDDTEHHPRALGCAINGFRERKAVGVVGNAHLTIEGFAQILVQALTDELGGVRVLDQTGVG